MGRGAAAPRRPLATNSYDPQAERAITALQQHVTVDAVVFDVRALGDLLVRSSRLGGDEIHLLASRLCSCGALDCSGRRSAEIARAGGLAAFAPLNPSESAVSARTFQAIPVGSNTAVVLRTDAWGDLVDVLSEDAGLVERHLLRPDRSCDEHESCDAALYVPAAVESGLRPFEPQGAAYAPVDPRGELWLAPYGMPARLGPPRVHVSAQTKSGVVVTEIRSGGPASFATTPRRCTCARPTVCLHRQLLARIAEEHL